jgi:hypothetical protein
MTKYIICVLMALSISACSNQPVMPKQVDISIASCPVVPKCELPSLETDKLNDKSTDGETANAYVVDIINLKRQIQYCGHLIDGINK